MLVLYPDLRGCEDVDVFSLQDDRALGTRYLIPHLVVDLYLEMVGEALTADIVPVVVRGQLKRGWESDE